MASSSLVALYKGNDLGSALASIAIRPNSIVSESLLKSRYPDADIVMCDNTTACFDALSSGRAQAVIIPVTALDVVRSQNDLSTYKTAELPGTVRLTAWMRQDAPTLLAIANKSIANSQDNITAGTYTAQSYGETETTLVRFVRLYQGAFVAGVDVVLVGIMAILVRSLLRARKAQQEAQAASSAKTAFLSRMSHDIRTPLNGIIRVLSVNEAHAEDAEYVSQNRKKARVAADHLFSLINDVLDMSKIEDSKVVLEHKPFNVIDVIDEVLVVGRLRAPERHAGSADAEGECDVSGMRVLLAEDNDLNLEIATTLLADEGVAVTCAANGREAFDTFVDRPAGSFDAILMDIMMPVMDGYEAARAIRRSVKADVGSVPIFAMTANAFAEDAQRAHDAGMNGHLTKPIDMEKVKQALATARR